MCMKNIEKWWNNRVEIKDKKDDENMKDTWKSKKFTIDEIKKLNYDLGQCGFPSKEEIILSPVDTIDNYQENSKNIKEKIDKNLDLIKELLKDKKW